MKEIDRLEDLRAPLETLLKSPDIPRVSRLLVEDRAYVVKVQEQWRSPRLAVCARRVRAVLVSWLCRWIFSQRPSPAQLLRNDIWSEGKRLRFLHEHGARVPEVIHHTGHALVMRDIGRVFPQHIREAEPQERQLWLDRATEALAEFHRQGFWHGGAQLRNITWFRGAVWRLDFEDALGCNLALPAAQAYDVFQLLQSMMLSREFADSRRLSIGARMLLLYLAHNPDPEIRISLLDVANWLHRMMPLVKLVSLVPGRDLKAFGYSSQVLLLARLPEVRQAQPERLRQWAACIERQEASTMPEIRRCIENDRNISR